MRVLVRNVLTGKYYKAPGQWTGSPEKAHDFKGTYHALGSKIWGKNEAVEIVFSFGDKKYDVCILVGGVQSNVSPRLPPGKNSNRGTQCPRVGKKLKRDIDKGQKAGGDK